MCWIYGTECETVILYEEMSVMFFPLWVLSVFFSHLFPYQMWVSYDISYYIIYKHGYIIFMLMHIHLFIKIDYFYIDYYIIVK